VSLARRRDLLTLGALSLVAAVCGGCSEASPHDPAPPSGGRQYVLDEEVYGTVISPVLTRLGCDNTACHGGGLRGTLELSPPDDKDLVFDFAQVARQVDPALPASSPLLMKPLSVSAGGDVHTAGDAFGFAATDDPDYQAVLAWIEAGAYR
jgi:hypothetical protein